MVKVIPFILNTKKGLEKRERELTKSLSHRASQVEGQLILWSQPEESTQPLYPHIA